VRGFVKWKAVAFTATAGFAVAADQGSKLLVVAALRGEPPGAVRTLIPDHLYLQVTGNALGPLGSLELMPPASRAVFFTVVTAAFAAFVVILAVRLRPTQRAQVWPLALLLGAVLSNGLDRLARGHVIDCVLLRLSPGAFQVWFNLADIATGAALAWLIWLHRRALKGSVA
jgi:lipoprotein signal peptidase